MTCWRAAGRRTILRSRLQLRWSREQPRFRERGLIPSSLGAYLALTTAAMAWGGSIVFQKFALGSFSAVEISVLRGLGALVVLVPLWWWQEGSTVKFTVRDLGLFAVLSLGVLGNHLLTLSGLQYIGAGAAGIIIGSSPVITALLSSLILRDVPFRAVAPGCVLSFAGVALIMDPGGSSNPEESPWLGGLLVAMGLVSWALYTIGSRRSMERFSALTVNWTTLGFSMLPQIALLPWFSKAFLVGLDSVAVSGWLALAYLSLVATALGQQAWLYGVKGIGPSRAGVFVNLIPVSALILSAIILGEAIRLQEVGGIIMILAGVWLVNRQSNKTSR
jgi:drug/metabolite transporter (DMT)-like permease